ncbi:glycoside hydrolase family 64 protein [Xylaria sp. CBS 124048]|nr:glycoside hydrolase family 64 protein [Xylaria sp. CBS 124048]
MRGFFGFAVAALAGLVVQCAADATIARPGGVDDLVITKDNTLNKTMARFKLANVQSGTLPISVMNNFGDGMNMYLTGLDRAGTPCLLGANGQYVYPQATSGNPQEIKSNIAIPLGGHGSMNKITLPGPLISARIWFAKGHLTFYTVKDGNGVPAIVEPSAVNAADPSADILWGFIEFNYDGTTIYANISYVDFVGLSLGMGLTLGTGETQIVKGLEPGAVESICNGVKKQADADGQPWDKLCVATSSGEALRVVSPNLYVSANEAAFEKYYTEYVNQVWTKYASEDLIINTQAGPGKVACRAMGNQMTCAGDNRTYTKPTTEDIWGCNSGPFAILPGDSQVHSAVVPRLCAAFDRSTLLLDGGNVQPALGAESYYTIEPTNHYSRIVHIYETNNVGYAFSYDDVNPDGQNAAGVVSGPNPTNLKVTVGGWS